MTKIKILGTATLLFAAIASPVAAQDERGLGSRYGWEPNGSASNETPRLNFRDAGNSGIRNPELTEPGDFAVTGGERSRAWNPTGQVDPGTSNSPAGNAGGE